MRLLIAAVVGVLLAAGSPGHDQGAVLLAAITAAAPVPDQGNPPAAVLGDTRPDEKESDNLYFLQCQAKEVRGRPVLEKALRKPGVAGLLPLDLKEDPVAWVQERLRVDIQPERRTLRVWLEAKELTRRSQAALVNALVEEHLSEVARRHREVREAEIRGLEVVHEANRGGLEARLVQRVQVMRILGAARAARYDHEIESLERTIETDRRRIEGLRAELRQPPRVSLVERARAER